MNLLIGFITGAAATIFLFWKLMNDPRFIYAYLRNDMVKRMKKAGFTWTKMSQVLNSLGQPKIISITKVPKGLQINYEEKKTEPKG